MENLSYLHFRALGWEGNCVLLFTCFIYLDGWMGALGWFGLIEHLGWVT